MKKELEEALGNVELTCARARLTRDEHITLSRNIQLLAKTIEEKSKPLVKEKPPKKKDKKDGDDSNT